MSSFLTVWAIIVFGILLLASLIEFNGARSGFHGANGIFLVASGALTFVSSPIPFIVTWVGSGFWTALKLCMIGAVAYAALFALALQLIMRFGRPSN